MKSNLGRCNTSQKLLCIYTLMRSNLQWTPSAEYQCVSSQNEIAFPPVHTDPRPKWRLDCGDGVQGDASKAQGEQGSRTPPLPSSRLSLPFVRLLNTRSSYPQPYQDPVFGPGFSSKLQSLPRPYILLPAFISSPYSNPLIQKHPSTSIAHTMSTRKRKQDEEEELQALPSDESEEEEE